MPQEVLNILLSALGVIITGLAGFAVTKFTQWINSKISDAKAANYLSTIMKVVLDCVQEIYQTYVQSLKESGSFDKDAQKHALDACLVKIKSQLAPELITYITTNFGDVNSYLISLIESTIYSLKNKNKDKEKNEEAE